MQRLHDLDELVLLCRDETARDYIREAVLAYRAGAIRSSIVASWIAVVFDYVHKLKELDLTGHADAQVALQRFLDAVDLAERSGDYRKLLEFEATLLDDCLKTFGFLSRASYDDLSRLRTDRHRCAHPTISMGEEIYQPTAEQARYHLRNAVEHMLIHPPVYGKAALEFLISEVASKYFPTTPKQAAKVLENGPLGRARPALIRNFVVVLLKTSLRGAGTFDDRVRHLAALQGCLALYHQETMDSLRVEVPRLATGTDEMVLERCLELLEVLPDLWTALPESQQDLLRGLIENSENSRAIIHGSHIPQLQETARSRLSKIQPKHFFERRRLGIHTYTDLQLAAELLEQSTNFDRANSVVRGGLRPAISDIKTPEVQKILECYVENSQVHGAYDATELIKELINSRGGEFIEELQEFDTRLDKALETISYVSEKGIHSIKSAIQDLLQDAEVRA